MRLEQSTLFLTSHLVIKQVYKTKEIYTEGSLWKNKSGRQLVRTLGEATYHMTEYCPLIGPQYPVQWDSS